jgi:predicted amidophosphoribosyltransferase
MRCPNCQAEYSEEEQLCPNCGEEAVVPSERGLVSLQSNLPAVLQNSRLPKNVAAGVGAVALGVGIELLRRGVVARLSRPPAPSMEQALPMLAGAKDLLFPRPEKPAKRPKKGYEIEETVVYVRRIIRR